MTDSLSLEQKTRDEYFAHLRFSDSQLPPSVDRGRHHASRRPVLPDCPDLCFCRWVTRWLGQSEYIERLIQYPLWK